MKVNSTLKNSTTKSQKVGRPINCFMAFRLDKHREISSQSPGLNHRDISKIIAKWWREATDSEKAPYRAIADKAKAEHAKKYPNYKYKPVKKSERKIRPYHRREDAFTREQKAKAQKQLLKQWLGDEDDEGQDNKSVVSYCSFSPSSIGSSSCSVNTQSYFDDTHIKPEYIEQEELDSFPLSLYQPMFGDDMLYDFAAKHSDDLLDCRFPLSQNISADLVTDFSSLEFFETPDYGNLQMLSLSDYPLML